MKRVIQYLLKGLTILLPLIVTLALVHWFLVTIETWLRPFWEAILGNRYYLPGLAIVSFMGIAMLIGFSTRWRFVNYLWALPGRIMERMPVRSEEHTSELQSRENLVCRLLLEKKKIRDCLM